jgi:hypothetical protein
MMRITGIETYTVSAGWKNWLFVKICAETEFNGIGEATINVRAPSFFFRHLFLLAIFINWLAPPL